MDHTQYSTNKAERKPGKHLTREDRGTIEAMKKLVQSNRAIARYLNCSPTTVSNELKRGMRPRTGRRGRTPGYSAKRGMLVYQTHRANSHKPHRICKCSAFVQWAVNKVRQEKWSLDACVGYARKHELFLPTEMVSTKTLYNEIWAINLVLQPLELPDALKRKKCCKSTAKRKKAYGATIDERPEITSSRLEVGHWEGDTVVGKTQRQGGGYSDIAGKENTALPCNSHSRKDQRGGQCSDAKSSVRTSESRSSAKYSRQLLWTTDQSLRILPKQNSSGQRFTLPTLTHPGNGRRTSDKTVCSVDMSPKGVSIENFSDEEILWAADALNGLPRRNLGYYTARWRNCLRLSWIPFTQPERLRKPQLG